MYPFSFFILSEDFTAVRKALRFPAMARSSLLLRCLLALATGVAFVAPSSVRFSAPVHAVAPAVLLAPSAAMAADGGAPSVVLGVGAWAVPQGCPKAHGVTSYFFCFCVCIRVYTV